MLCNMVPLAVPQLTSFSHGRGCGNDGGQDHHPPDGRVDQESDWAATGEGGKKDRNQMVKFCLVPAACCGLVLFLIVGTGAAVQQVNDQTNAYNLVGDQKL